MKNKIKLVAGVLFAATVAVQATPITNGLYMELVADDITGVADGASVTAWNDTATTANSLAQYGTLAPVFVSTNANFNNHSTVSFVGNSALRDNSLAGTAPSTETVTVFMVAQYNAQPTNNNPEWLFRSQSTGNTRLRIARSGLNQANGGAYQTRVGGGAGIITGTNSGRNTDLILFNIRSGGNTVNFDTFSASATNSVTGANGAGLRIPQVILGANTGPANYANADIAEFLIYDRALSTTEIAQVNTYLVAKYAIPEPATLGLIVIMGGGLFFARRRRRYLKI